MNYDQHKEVIKGKTLTAYELADAMDTKGFRYREVKSAVVMLRQQADRIAELEKAGYDALHKFAKTYDENKRLKNKIDEMLELLVRYRNETPLGNQPHMIAHIADEVIEKAKKLNG